MSFISIAFLFFLPIVFAVYWALGRYHRWQNLCLLVASYVFYGWWDWRFLILILVTSLSSFLSGLWMGRCQPGNAKARCLLVGNIILNIGILAVFKYYDFFVTSLCSALSPLGISPDLPTLGLILPVGISFYTFQSLSYSVDVYRRQLEPTRDVVAFFTFIAFFPQLVAGPIERATNLLPQMLMPRRFRYAEAVEGLRRILWGAFKKMVIADNCALAVNSIWADVPEASALTLFVGMLLFTFQIYGDFSGYSDIAIGTARLFGIRLKENFRLPYFSRSMAEFWRRWHISLMTWFRDYLYIPLGGSRHGQVKLVRNTLVVFLLSGLWHGANWTFVLWGLYHGVLLVGERMVRGDKREKGESMVRLADGLKVLLVFLLVCIGWVVFRAESVGDAIAYLGQMGEGLFTMNFGGIMHGKRVLLWCLLLVVVEWIQRKREHPLDFRGLSFFERYRACRWAVYYLVALIIIFARGEGQTFIYFQF